MRPYKCRGCKEYFRPPEESPGIRHCSLECGTAILKRLWAKERLQQERAQKRAKTAQKKVWAKEKREYKKNDYRVRKPAAKKACHSYIKERDKNELCICCNEPLGDDFQAGHWLESGNNPQVRYDENNIHAQRLHCNFYKGGDSGDYEKNLRSKIGDAAVDELITKKGGTVKRTAEEYLEIESHFKKKLEILNAI